MGSVTARFNTEWRAAGTLRLPFRSEEFRWRHETGRILDDREHDWAKQEILVWLTIKAPRAIFAEPFVEQLARHFLRYFELLGGRRYLFSIHHILDCIAENEGTTETLRTGLASRFGARPAPFLRGLWHKHFNDPQFLYRNLSQETIQNFGYLWHLFQGVREKAGLRNDTDIAALTPLLTDTVLMKGLKNRYGTLGEVKKRSRMTGEWIIFAKCGTKNTYLSLATHEEAKEAAFHPELVRRLKQAISALHENSRQALVRELNTALL